ncbi:arylsulfatase : Sulfatase OS=Chthoniobacter flavus Ellin428 GN=CfE428DRAFT_3130 PE=4 SV=1: Sulfatase [Gemmataceae bacterium]|nr:arylsulfatase : Sulfatase OS=Chthoniobacter flavus Ellin428 GN=CfE428DRAFT_3130 PE=4 SV=1: Sulfatase [Gemmataceae bacterium]VTT99780.1 arylsulfatase : Sulfatase OS=Chthoniobacter flavus Ellin428 GN=CfE428DRAFT_3130 PE=4 SV=1: Sulfatase [Gemmataceae bacterium]
MPRLLLSIAALVGASFAPVASAADKPNIVLIYADDIGYGDLSCYGATKVETPNCDKLAAAGLKFTDGHSVASVCTPSRYSLMTGEYAFRKKGTGIASGVQGLLIDPDRAALPGVLQKAGYRTGVVGKWHLGLGTTPTDYNAALKPGPREVGFDYAWILPATGDRVPCVWVENDRVVNLDPKDPIKLDYAVKRGDKESFVNDVPRIGGQTGGTAALWKDDEMSLVIAEKSCAFIEKEKDKPFFLFMATHNIHVPRVPNAKFKGKSDCGVRGDAIVEFDWTVGQVLDKLDTLGLAENTLVVLTSDNGGVLDDNGPDKVNGIGDPDGTNGHKPNGALRGTKGTVFEGGTRVPFVVRWPAKVKPGTSDALMSQMDLLASFAALTGQRVPKGQAPDSENHLEALLGTKQTGREFLVEQSNGGAPFGFRHGTWKLTPGGPKAKEAGPGLFDLATDLGEAKNLAAAHPDRVAAMRAKLAEVTGPPVPKKDTK